MNILLISNSNDNDAGVWIKQTLSDFLERPVHIHHSYHDHKAAIELMDKHSIECVLIIDLAPLQCLQLLEKVLNKYPYMPMIVLAEAMDADLAKQVLMAGALDVLIKARQFPELLSHATRFALQWNQAHDRFKVEVQGRKEAQVLLRQENEFISSVLDTVSALVVVLDAKGRIVGFNKAAETACGYSAIDVYGKSVWEYFIPANEMEAAMAAIDGLSSEKQSSSYQGHWLTRNGSRILVHWNNTVLLNASGQTKYIICSGIDVTDSARIQDADKRHMLDLFHLSRLSTMGEMATEIAHELNQPLAAIVSFSDTCKRMLDKDNWVLDEVSATLKEINLQANRASEIIHELRRFAHKQETHRSSIDINQLVKEVAHLIEIETRYHHIDVEMSLNEPMPLVMANKILIEQVILNLVRNAIEAMAGVDESQRNMKIVVATKQNSMVSVSVSDSGPGISPKSIGHIFEPFYTTKKDGTGMGLSISKSIINIHKGELWVTNNLDGGASFHFSLPINNKGA